MLLAHTPAGRPLVSPRPPLALERDAPRGACRASATGSPSSHVRARRRPRSRRVLPRRTALIRKESGYRTEGQVLAANMDYVWIVSSLTRELSARRVERFLTVAWESGAQPVVVLTKADVDDANPDDHRRGRGRRRGGRRRRHELGDGPRASTSCARCSPATRRRRCSGSSGVGKSTLINTLVGDELLETKPTRDDAVGRHTTTHRELVRVPSGGMLIDTPGLRELIAWDNNGGMGDVYTRHRRAGNAVPVPRLPAPRRARLRDQRRDRVR